MTTPCPPNPIYMSDIMTEFGGTGTTYLNRYYGAAVGVPTSGAISFNDMRCRTHLEPVYITNYYTANAIIDMQINVKFSLTQNLLYGSYVWAYWGQNGQNITSWYKSGPNYDPAILAKYTTVRAFVTSSYGRHVPASGEAYASAATNWEFEFMLGADGPNGAAGYGATFGIQLIP